MIYVLGVTLSYLLLILGVFLLIMLGAAVFGFEAFLAAIGVEGMGGLANWPKWLSVGVTVVTYFAVFLLWGVFYNVFVIFPIMRHMALTTSLTEHGGLTEISQRARDHFAEAEGFAEALDLGAAI
jgi:hypothetical protein